MSVSDGSPPAAQLLLFGEIAQELGFLQRPALEKALANQKTRVAEGKPPLAIGELLIEAGVLDLRTVMKVLVEQKRRRESLGDEIDNQFTRLGPFDILDHLGTGGMGSVYKACDRALDRTVALKVLSLRLNSDAEFLERFHREVQTTGALSHPNIVGGFGAGLDDGRRYLIMEFVEGQSLGRIMHAGRMDERRGLEIAREVARALEHAHVMGIVHRDVKPDNVLIGVNGNVKLTDFGLAKLLREQKRLTQSDIALGTPHYISPEQVSSTRYIDHRADLYSLGAMLYHMLTGKLAFDGANNNDIMLKHLHEELAFPVAPVLSPGASAIIKRLMAKKATDRYDSCTQVIEDIGHVLQAREPLHALAPVRVDAVPEEKKKENIGCGVGLVLCAIGVLVVVNWCKMV